MRLFTRSFLLAAGLLLAAEIAVRPLMPQTVAGRFSYGYDHVSGFVERPGAVDFVRTGGRRFRPQSLAMPKPPGTYRVFVVGDSVPRGPTLEEAYAWQLQGLLRAGGIPAEVVNLGVPGYGVRRCRVVLERILKYQPDLVILHVNDSNEYEDEREWRRSLEFNDWHPRHWLMKSFIFRRAYEVSTELVFWKLLPQAVRQQTAADDADTEVAAMSDQAQVAEWRQRVAQYIHGDVALVQAARVRLLVIAQTRYAYARDGSEKRFEGGKRLHVARTQDAPPDLPLDSGAVGQLVSGLEAPGVLTLDMRPVLADHQPAELFQDSGHLNVKGQRFMAEAIREKLSQAGWLPGKVGP